MKIIKLTLLLTASVTGPTVWAASGGHGDHGVPWGLIIPQIVNFSILVFLLVYLLRNKAKAHFQERSESYQALLTRAESAKKEAEANKKEISERLARLESTAEETVTRAKAEAADLKAKILEDAENLSRRLKEEAKRTADFEIQRAKEELRQDLLQQAVQDARQSMEKDVQDPDQKRLQNEFVQRVQVVSQ